MSTESHNDTLQCENQMISSMLIYQGPQLTNHHGDAPHISVTESTPETKRKCVQNTTQRDSESECPADAEVLLSNEEEKLVNVIHHGQRGQELYTKLRFGDRAFLNVLANSQSRRLDDQRVSLPSLPGIDKDSSNSNSNPESNYLCYMVSKVQGSRMDDQRCSLPQLITTGSQVLSENSLSTNGSERARSASFCTNADIYPSKRTSVKKNPAEQDGFFNMISRAQQRRMEDQRCELKPKDSEAFFNQLATSQSNRLDDQRLSLPSLPGIQNGGKKSNAAENEANYLCYMVSKVQGSRMDEQRCSAPFIFQNMSPSFQRKDSGRALQRSSSLNRTKNSKQEISAPQQEEFFKMMKHAQKGRMEEQRCSLPSSTPATPTHNGSALNNMSTGAGTDTCFRSQGSRQRTDPSVLPRASGTSTEKQKTANKKDALPKTAPQITVTQSTPTTSKKDFTRPLSMPQVEHVEHASLKSFPKSASYCQEASPPQVTVRVSMSFSSLQGLANPDQPSNFPELFLTLGAPGDNFVIPLSPVPGRRLSLSLNLIPKENTDTELNPPSSWKSHSGPPSPTVNHSPSSPRDKSMLVALTQAVKGPGKRGNKTKGKGKDKPTQDKGKKMMKKDKLGNKHKTG
ncbi:hypothetical protein WMY93_003789 [Mugilogobius chulae]|uniref:Uncharacterized protein n=1 Tax=Mugilogobius chulae TaxID=88201 RepID=A0AAW0PXR2_9GOBI